MRDPTWTHKAITWTEASPADIFTAGKCELGITRILLSQIWQLNDILRYSPRCWSYGWLKSSWQITGLYVNTVSPVTGKMLSRSQLHELSVMIGKGGPIWNLGVGLEDFSKKKFVADRSKEKKSLYVHHGKKKKFVSKEVEEKIVLYQLGKTKEHHSNYTRHADSTITFSTVNSRP